MHAERPIAIDLFAGLGGWTEGLMEVGYDCIGFDIERDCYGEHRYPAQLVVQDVLTLHGSQFRNAALIVASPPCQEYSYMAMPWSRGKQIARALRGEDDFPKGYKGSHTLDELNALFNACFRIQREACETAGHHIPMVVENVRGAIPWVGRSAWNYGSFHLWGDVPALMPPIPSRTVLKEGITHRNDGSTSFHGIKQPGNCSPRTVRDREIPRLNDGYKNPGQNWSGYKDTGEKSPHWSVRHIKQPGISGKRNNGKGDKWFQDGAAAHGSKSSSRKMASAMIAKIPAPLAHHIGKTYLPEPHRSTDHDS